MLYMLLADDRPIVQAGLALTLAQTPDLRLIDLPATTAFSTAALCQLCREFALHVLLVSMGLPGLQLATLLAWLQRECPRVHPLLLVAPCDEAPFRLLALLQNWGDVLGMHEPLARWLAAIRTLGQGGTWISTQLVPGDPPPESPPLALGTLTKRQTQILALLCQGLSNRAMAIQLQIKERTVEFHITNLLARLGVPSRAAAIVWAQAHAVTPNIS